MFKNIAIVIVLVVIALAGLFVVIQKSKESREKEVTMTEEQKPVIVTSFYPLYFLTSAIAGDTAEVININPHTDPHDFSPTVQDTQKMYTADLVIINGGGLEPWGQDMERELQKNNVPMLVLGEEIIEEHEEEVHEEDYGHESEENHETEADKHGHEDEGSDHEEKHEGEEHEEDGHGQLDAHGHDHGGKDPHIWLSPILAGEIVHVISEKLTELFEENANIYKENTEKLETEISTIENTYSEELSSCKNQEALITHDAFGYIEEVYNLTLHPISGLSTKDTPSAKALAELEKLAHEKNLALLVEDTEQKDFAETLSRETDIAMFPLYTLAFNMDASELDYFSGLLANLESLKHAHECL